MSEYLRLQARGMLAKSMGISEDKAEEYLRKLDMEVREHGQDNENSVDVLRS